MQQIFNEFPPTQRPLLPPPYSMDDLLRGFIRHWSVELWYDHHVEIDNAVVKTWGATCVLVLFDAQPGVELQFRVLKFETGIEVSPMVSLEDNSLHPGLIERAERDLASMLEQ